jgi:hypothetical protein
VSCADDRPPVGQLALWAPEPAGVEPANEEQVEALGPQLWRRRQWIPIDDLPDIDTYQPAA